MDACILHYGMNKTGTSSIQRSLYHGLVDPRFRYLDLGRPNASDALVCAFSATPHRHAMSRKHGRSESDAAELSVAMRERLSAELSRARGRTALVSGESIPWLRPPEWRAMAAFLRERADGLRAVGYIRGPRGYLESIFQQNVKGGLGRFDLAAQFPQYRTRLAKLERVLPAGATEYWPFHPAGFPERCVVRDFCARLGIDLPAAAIRRTNEALSLPALRFLYTYRKFGPAFGSGDKARQENARLVHRLQTLPGPRFRLHHDLVDPLMESNRDELQWMDERVAGIMFTESVYSEDTVRGEADLLRHDEDSLRWLARQLGTRDDDVLAAAADPQAICGYLHRLRALPEEPTGAAPLSERLRRAARRLGRTGA